MFNKAPLIFLILLYAQSIGASGLQEFKAEYEIFYGDIHLGNANYRFTHSQEDQYRFDFSSELSFLIFWDERVVSSELTHDDQRLLPTYYRHDRKGTGSDYLEEIEFDRANQRILATYQEESKELDYEEDVIDGLTMQLQMMLDLRRGIEQPSYRIVDFNRLKEYEFGFERTETIDIQGTEYECVVYRVVRDHERRTTEMWFSPERNYLPIRMAHYSKGKKKFNAQLVEYVALDGAGASFD